MFPKLFSGVLGCVKDVRAHLDDDLMQRHILCVLSRLLTETEPRYSLAEKEALCVVWVMRKGSHLVDREPLPLCSGQPRSYAQLYSNAKSKPPA